MVPDAEESLSLPHCLILHWHHPTKGQKMKCPYCNKILKQIKFIDTFTCLNPDCKKSIGMTGTFAMWEKVASLVKIRNANITYRRKPETKKKICERNKKYRETHKEYYKEYMKKYNQRKKDNK